MLDIEEIKARAEKATQFTIHANEYQNKMVITPLTSDNVEFLTYAAYDILNLVAEVETLQKKVVELRGYMHHFGDECMRQSDIIEELQENN